MILLIVFFVTVCILIIIVLTNIFVNADLPPHQSSLDAAVTSDRKNACTVDVETMKVCM